MYGYEYDIDLIRHWLIRNKVSSTTLSLAMGSGAGLIGRVLKGRCTIKTLTRVLRHVKKYPKVRNRYKGR